MWRAWLLVVTGCGRIAFDPRGDATGSTTDGDAAGTPDCWAGWRAHTPQVGAPRLLDELTSGSPQGDVSLARDGLTLYFVRNSDIYSATRPTTTSRWTLGSILNMVSNASADTKLTTTADDLTGVFATDRNGTFDFFAASRSSTSAPWSINPNQTGVAALNTTANELDPDLTADGLHLYYAPDPAGSQQIVVASRPDLASVFAFERNVTELALGTTYSDPTLSPDELVIVYAAMANAMLFYATRTSKTAQFGTPVAVPAVNGGGRQTDSELSSDGCELYFSSTRGGTRDLYVSVIVP